TASRPPGSITRPAEPPSPGWIATGTSLPSRASAGAASPRARSRWTAPRATAGAACGSTRPPTTGTRWIGWRTSPTATGASALSRPAAGGWGGPLGRVERPPRVKAICERGAPVAPFLGDASHPYGAFRLYFGFDFIAGYETDPSREVDFEYGPPPVDAFDWFL